VSPQTLSKPDPKVKASAPTTLFLLKLVAAAITATAHKLARIIYHMVTTARDRFYERSTSPTRQRPQAAGIAKCSREILAARMDRPFYRAMQESQFLTFLTRATRVLCRQSSAGLRSAHSGGSRQLRRRTAEYSGRSLRRNLRRRFPAPCPHERFLHSQNRRQLRSR
jgi:hypothetical protein